MKRILSLMRNCIEKYEMINEGDIIAVGLSGGKDSLTLLTALKKYQIFSKQKFELVAICVDIFGNSDFTKLEGYCETLNVPFYVEKSNIIDVVFNERKEKNPCSLCAKMRRGALNSKAIELGCNKIALGHHADDLIETFFLSMFYEGRLSSFAPVTFMDRTGITSIRPLLNVTEKHIISVSKQLPIMDNCCPANKHTQREYIKQLLLTIKKDIPFVKDRVFGALTNPERYNLFDKFTKKIDG